MGHSLLAAARPPRRVRPAIGNVTSGCHDQLKCFFEDANMSQVSSMCLRVDQYGWCRITSQSRAFARLSRSTIATHDGPVIRVSEGFVLRSPTSRSGAEQDGPILLDKYNILHCAPSCGKAGRRLWGRYSGARKSLSLVSCSYSIRAANVSNMVQSFGSYQVSTYALDAVGPVRCPCVVYSIAADTSWSLR